MAKVEYEKKGEIAFITINRPKAMNAIDFEMVELMHKIWDDFNEDQELRVAVLTAAGDHFCVGFDIMSMLDRLGRDKFDWTKSAIHGDVNCNPIHHGVKKPIVAAVTGNVNGVGLWLVLASDIRIATPETSFGLGEVRINFPVEFTALLPRFMPLALASEMLITGRNITAQRFYDLGIINALVEKGELMNEAEKAAKQICGGGPLAIEAMKQLIHKGYDLDYEAIMNLSDKIVSPVVNSQDTKEALRAFSEKRKPVWTGK